MKSLPYETIVNIARFLPVVDVVCLSSCGKAFGDLCRDDFLFHILYERDYKKYAENFSPVPEDISSWKKLYTILHINKEYMINTMRKYYGFKVHIE